jgi:ribosomal protein S1
LPEFDKLDPLPTPAESEWPAIKQRFPVGTEVTGVVISRQAFGIFLELGGGALALIERPSMQWRSDADPMASPPLGMEVRGTVIGHADYNRQVRVEAPDPWVRHQRTNDGDHR